MDITATEFPELGKLLRTPHCGAVELAAGRDTWLSSRTWGDNWQVQQYSIV